VIRLSAKTFHGLDLNVGNSIKMVGTLKENKRYGYLLMRIAKAKFRNFLNTKYDILYLPL